MPASIRIEMVESALDWFRFEQVISVSRSEICTQGACQFERFHWRIKTNFCTTDGKWSWIWLYHRHYLDLNANKKYSRSNKANAVQDQIEPHAETRYLITYIETKLLIPKRVCVCVCVRAIETSEISKTFIINVSTHLECDKQQYELYATPTMSRAHFNQFNF